MLQTTRLHDLIEVLDPRAELSVWSDNKTKVFKGHVYNAYGKDLSGIIEDLYIVGGVVTVLLESQRSEMKC